MDRQEELEILITHQLGVVNKQSEITHKNPLHLAAADTLEAANQLRSLYDEYSEIKKYTNEA